ncbi:hypothetical protein GQX73_g7086 [Xylaria multiplex]|uniref:DUF7924 domain-containing protein n=1 Tax=Xylaria multiplex TaxID=323545 RepID=A0A7C8IU27_9PEZI|nr:hypothetical protein GQX73_g7086 [Xylaria multiplex]
MSSIPSMKSRNSLRKCGSSDLDNSHTSPYDRAFRQHLIDYGIYPDQYEDLDGHDMPPPENLGEIVRAMAKPRPSLSISRSTQGDFKTFEKRDSNASKKAKVINTVIPMIEEELANSQSICRQVPFSNLDHLTDGSLVSGNPDLYYGARPEQLDLRVRKQLGKQIVPSTQHDLPVVPNFFLNVKGQDGSASVAELQACYDGALGARGINSLQMYGDPELDLDNKAYTLTATYQAGTLRIYASYPRVSARPGKPHEYLTKKNQRLVLNWQC